MTKANPSKGLQGTSKSKLWLLVALLLALIWGSMFARACELAPGQGSPEAPIGSAPAPPAVIIVFVR